MVFLVAAALANDGPPPKLWAEVSGSSVAFSLTLYDSGEPGIHDTYDLVRLEDDVAVEALLTDATFDAAAATATTGLCRVWDDEPDADCTATPDVCSDCDGDGVAECAPNGVCLDGWVFGVTDTCVEPGTWTWELRQDGEDHGSETTATIEDLGQDCAEVACPQGGDGSAECPSTWGCATAAEAGIGAAMVALGLVAWRRR